MRVNLYLNEKNCSGEYYKTIGVVREVQIPDIYLPKFEFLLKHSYNEWFLEVIGGMCLEIKMKSGLELSI